MSVIATKPEVDLQIKSNINSQKPDRKSNLPALCLSPKGDQNEILVPELDRRERDRRKDAIETGHSVVAGPEHLGIGRIAVIEGRVFLRECIRRGMQALLPHDFDTFASVDEFERDPNASMAHLIVLSCSAADEMESHSGRGSLERLMVRFPRVAVVVLASRQEPELIGTTLGAGAKGYIPMSMGFDLAVEAVRFVLAGGTYFPPEFLTAAPAPDPADPQSILSSITARELLVVRAIQQGKPNKIIAYELNMCESTVKVHVRHIMKKMGAKNRTAVAMKSNELLGAAAATR
jgi:DNA-binding NarL/FixJ family response regulator